MTIFKISFKNLFFKRLFTFLFEKECVCVSVGKGKGRESLRILPAEHGV